MDPAWRVRGVRGATTAETNTAPAIREAVLELALELDRMNQLIPTDLVMVLFTCTPDLDACFPSQVVREHFPGWDQVPLMDLAHMPVKGSLPRCIRVIIQLHTSKTQLTPVYLRGAQALRPDLIQVRRD